MTVIPEPNASLLAELQDLASRGDLASRCLCLRSYQSHRLKAVDIDTVFLVLPLQGIKRMREHGQTLSVGPGEILLVPGPRRLDVENLPDPASGEYAAIGIAIHEETLDLARRLFPERTGEGAGKIASMPLDALSQPLTAWCTALKSGRIPFACHALLGLVLALYEMGHHGVLERRIPSLTERVRGMIAEAPAREWMSSDIESAVAMSGASIRRRLAAEGTSLRSIIVEARLACALELLYTTRLPVKAVAQRVGYASASSFCKRFAERYGVEPSRVGGT